MHGWKRAEPGVARRAQPRLRAAAKAEMGAFYPLLLLRSLEAERPDAGGQAVALAALAPLVAQPQLLARARAALLGRAEDGLLAHQQTGYVTLAALAPLVAQPQLLARAPPALQPARQGMRGSRRAARAAPYRVRLPRRSVHVLSRA
jgi:hypothetical protein